MLHRIGPHHHIVCLVGAVICNGEAVWCGVECGVRWCEVVSCGVRCSVV